MEFELYAGLATLAKGYVDSRIVDGITDPTSLKGEMDRYRETASSRSAGGGDIKEILGEDLANFLFISSLLDYGNIGTSETFRLQMLELYKLRPFLFRPSSSFWQRVRASDEPESSRILQTLLFSLSGLLRTSFEGTIVPSWYRMIDFLYRECESDAANFYLAACQSLSLEPSKPESLETLRSRLEDSSLRDRLRMGFPWGPKISLVLLSQMTDNARGYGILKGTTREHVKLLKSPIDSAVIRVILNTGLVKITYVSPAVSEGKFQRTDLTEPCQRAMDMLADKLGILAVEADEYIWTVGTQPCKYRGRYCFVCPLTSFCETWRNGYVRESAGDESGSRCFSFSRPQTEKNALYLRGCTNCPHSSGCTLIIPSTGIRHPTYDDNYKSQRYSDSSDKLTEEELESFLSGDTTFGGQGRLDDGGIA